MLVRKLDVRVLIELRLILQLDICSNSSIIHNDVFPVSNTEDKFESMSRASTRQSSGPVRFEPGRYQLIEIIDRS